MNKSQKRLTASDVKSAEPGSCLHDGYGLYLKTGKTADNKKYTYRFTWNHKPTEIGIGSARTTTLSEARDKAQQARRLVAQGINPITAKREKRIAAVSKPTFGQCATALIKSKQGEWRNALHREQWRQTLEVHCAPIWATPVDAIDTTAVLSVLKPLWGRIPETASRLRGRIEAVLNYAKAHNWRTGENPAAWRGHLALILPKRQKLTRGHHAAMPYGELPAFMARLREQESMPSLALQFLILTAARSGEVLGARWSEFDFDAKIWVIPAIRMKAGVEHRVPLSEAAMEIVNRLAAIRTGERVFVASGSALRLLVPDATVHGFRSAFRDWCGNETSFAREIAEAALAHRTGDSTEQAYRRGDALEKRRGLMQAWAAYCMAGDNVLRLVI